MPDSAGNKFIEELDAITKDVTESLNREDTPKKLEENEQGGGGSGETDDKTKEELKAVREALTKVTGHAPATALPEPIKREGVAETDHLDDAGEVYQKKVGDLVNETYTGGGIIRAVNNALRENDPLLLDLYHDTMTREIHQRLADQNIL